MDTMMIMEKIASNGASDFSVKIASDILTKTNEKLAEIKIAVGRLPTGEYLKLLASMTGEAKSFMSKNLNKAMQLTDPEVVRQTHRAAKQVTKQPAAKATTTGVSKAVTPAIQQSVQQTKKPIWRPSNPTPAVGAGASEASKLYENVPGPFEGILNSGYIRTVNR